MFVEDFKCTYHDFTTIKKNNCYIAAQVAEKLERQRAIKPLLGQNQPKSDKYFWKIRIIRKSSISKSRYLEDYWMDFIFFDEKLRSSSF